MSSSVRHAGDSMAMHRIGALPLKFTPAALRCPRCTSPVQYGMKRYAQSRTGFRGLPLSTRPLAEGALPTVVDQVGSRLSHEHAQSPTVTLRMASALPTKRTVCRRTR
jgi:hypothetical protein